MSDISKMINDLNNAYGEISVEKVKVLCRVAGVEYKNPSQAKQLFQDLQEQGYKLEITKHSVADDSVGQTMVLRDTADTFIRGYRVWIDFQDNYEVKVADLYSDVDLSNFGGIN